MRKEIRQRFQYPDKHPHHTTAAPLLYDLYNVHHYKIVFGKERGFYEFREILNFPTSSCKYGKVSI